MRSERILRSYLVLCLTVAGLLAWSSNSFAQSKLQLLSEDNQCSVYQGPSQERITISTTKYSNREQGARFCQQLNAGQLASLQDIFSILNSVTQTELQTLPASMNFKIEFKNFETTGLATWIRHTNDSASAQGDFVAITGAPSPEVFSISAVNRQLHGARLPLLQLPAVCIEN